jgi:cytochrome c oxidase subunit 3/cytochrome o ubiquinol oxidase subunit 3
MSALTIPNIQPVRPWVLPDRGKVAMAALIIAESAIFTIFVVAYLFYAGKSLTGPTPSEVLETPVFYSICLLSSSITVHLAARFLEQGKQRGFLSWWFLTFVLGGLFLFGTGQEWHRLIYEKGLTISTNLFGTTYYSLVGLHAFHLTAGLVMLLIVLIFGLAGRVDQGQSSRIGVLSLYWHFVDAVWVVVFTVVYILGR